MDWILFFTLVLLLFGVSKGESGEKHFMNGESEDCHMCHGKCFLDDGDEHILRQVFNIDGKLMTSSDHEVSVDCDVCLNPGDDSVELIPNPNMVEPFVEPIGMPKTKCIEDLEPGFSEQGEKEIHVEADAGEEAGEYNDAEYEDNYGDSAESHTSHHSTDDQTTDSIESFTGDDTGSAESHHSSHHGTPHASHESHKGADNKGHGVGNTGHGADGAGHGVGNTGHGADGAGHGGSNKGNAAGGPVKKKRGLLDHYFKEETPEEANKRLQKMLEIVEEPEDPTDVGERAYPKLESELTRLNPGNQSIKDLIAGDPKPESFEERPLKVMMEEIDKAYKGRSALLPPEKNPKIEIKNWAMAELKIWGAHVKVKAHMSALKRDNVKKDKIIPEIFAVLMQAIYIKTKEDARKDPKKEAYTPRPAQILAVLVLINRATDEHDNLRGRFAQIQTGEGKTAIWVMTAGFLALMGRVVDVITSSHVLADRDAAEWRTIFSSIGLSIVSNSSRKMTPGEPKACYVPDEHGTHPIVVGSAYNFIGDLLEQIFEGNNTMGTRPQEYLIVDEVDDMAKDNKSTTVKLTKNLPGADKLEKLLIEILKENRKMHTERGIDSLLSEKVIVERIVKHIEAILREKKGKIPHQFIDEFKLDLFDKESTSFIKKNVRLWVRSMLKAQMMKVNKDYTVNTEEDIIKVVDFKRTGVIHPDQRWADFLHEFVILKEMVTRLTSLTLNSCYMSFLWFMNLYKGNLLGISGTILGPIYMQQYFTKTFPVDLVEIPPYMKPKFIPSKNHTIVKNKKDWVYYIRDIAMNLTSYNEEPKDRKERCILIICQSIADVKLLEKYIGAAVDFENNPTPERQSFWEKRMEKLMGTKKKTTYEPPPRKVKVYGVQDGKVDGKKKKDKKKKDKKGKKDKKAEPINEEDVVKHPLEVGDIVISSAKGSRGSDFKPSKKCNENGGIHTIAAFRPDSDFILRQIWGRSKRAGKNGSGQMIINIKDVPGFEDKDPTKVTIDQLNKDRDDKEKAALEHFEKYEKKGIDFLDIKFKEFTDLFNELRFGIDAKTKQINKPPEKYNSYTDSLSPYWKQMIELWGFRHKYYSMIIDDARNDEENPLEKLTEAYKKIDADFKIFLPDLRKKFNKDEIKKNPLAHFVNAGYLIQLGSKLYWPEGDGQQSSKKRDTEGAMKAYEKAIAQEPDFAFAAHINRVYIEAEKENPNMDTILADIEAGQKNIKALLADLDITIKFLSKAEGGLRKQMDYRVEIYNKLYDMLENAHKVVTATLPNFREHTVTLNPGEKNKKPKTVKKYASCKLGIFGTTLRNSFDKKDKMKEEFDQLEEDGLFTYFQLKPKCIDNPDLPGKPQGKIQGIGEPEKKGSKRKEPKKSGPKKHRRR